MSRRWQLQEAKNRLSEVVDLALEKGPQVVTRHGKAVVVVVAKSEFDRRRAEQSARGSIVAFLRSLNFAKVKLQLERDKDLDRDVDL